MPDGSILTSTKKVLGIPEDYKVFDPDIVMHINSVFATLNQMGIGPEDGFEIEDDSITWDHFLLGNPKFNMLKSYMYLRVRMLFDPPTTSFLIDAMKTQREEFEWRLSVLRESGAWVFNAIDNGALADLDGGNAAGG